MSTPRPVTDKEAIEAARRLRVACRLTAHSQKDRYAATELGGMGMYLFRGSTVWLAGAPTEPLGLLVIYPAKRSHEGWGKYLNRYLIVTHPAHRGEGLARALDQAANLHYLQQGYTRVKTTSGTRAGWSLHHAYRWPAWVVNKGGQLVHDAPLHPDHDHPGVPPAAAKLGATRALTVEEQRAILDDPAGPYATKARR